MDNRLHRLSWLHGIELFEANFDKHVFGKHAHETFAIGAIMNGVGGYTCRGADHVLPVGSLSLMNPEEMHTGHSLHGQLRYNMVYVSENAVRDLLDVRELPGFREISPLDRSHSLAWTLDRLGMALNQRNTIPAWRLQVEELVHDLLGLSFTRFGSVRPARAGREPRAVQLVSDYIEAQLDTPEHPELSIGDMASLAGLHPNYLIQSFSRAKGISPYAYFLYRKVLLAKDLMAAGGVPLQVALRLGFFDQAHFIKHFRKVFGVTPGNFIIH